MMKFGDAKQLREYLDIECKGNCDHCRWRVHDGSCMLMARIMQIDYRWIPTRERMPDKTEEGKPIIMTICDGGLSYIRFGTYHDHKGIKPIWVLYGYGISVDPDKVEAWQLAPEPYRKETQDEETSNDAAGGNNAPGNSIDSASGRKTAK